MKSNTAKTMNTGRPQEPSRLDLLQQVLLHNTSINTTLLRLMWERYTSASNAPMPEGNVVYSMIKAVNLQQADQRPGIQIYPNPVNQKISLSSLTNSKPVIICLELVGYHGSGY